ncbi:hypothetical protein ACIBL6_13915 [Streptomyces sp. NPDC050400]|uniref:DUF3592 domain-containing protein n=1 Tax=Streptomyces sp. NPDC050400 TaxID=3365610 RepID=UPI0037966F77
MSISSPVPVPVPVLQGDRGTELRSLGAELLLRRPDAELRIPLAAIARVHAVRRDVTVELTAGTGGEPITYRVTDVSAAAATVFADAVNAALPERSAGEETVDGSTLVVIRSLVFDDDEVAVDENDVRIGLPSFGRWLLYAACAAVAVLAVVVGLVDGDWSRAIATLLLGEGGVWLTYFTVMGATMSWREWYLPRYGITVYGQQVFRDGETPHAFTATDGVTRYITGHNKGRPVRVAYHPRNPANAVVCTGVGERLGILAVFVVVGVIAGLIDYGTYRLVLPAFGG